MRALQVFAGPRAREHLRQHGLAPADVRVIPAAAGGAKGLVLLPLDRFLFGQWLAGDGPPVHLLGASIGAWRMAVACMPDAVSAIDTLAEDYITQSYPHRPGRMPTPRVITEVLRRRLDERIGQHAFEALRSPRLRLHVFTSRGRRLLHRPGRLGMPLGWLSAFTANAWGRPAMGGWLERVVFSDPRDELPFPLADYPTRQVSLTPTNLAPAVLASCTIPFAIEAVQDVPGGPAGTYWDGGITDYHLHLNYAAMQDGLVLYPHFGGAVIPGWLDKGWKRRHGATAALDNVVLLAPQPDWVRRLPLGRLPSRADFKTYGDDHAARQRDWRIAVAESQRLAEEFATLVDAARPFQALPLG
jgi:hypothetical protein